MSRRCPAYACTTAYCANPDYCYLDYFEYNDTWGNCFSCGVFSENLGWSGLTHLCRDCAEKVIHDEDNLEPLEM